LRAAIYRCHHASQSVLILVALVFLQQNRDREPGKLSRENGLHAMRHVDFAPEDLFGCVGNGGYFHLSTTLEQLLRWCTRRERGGNLGPHLGCDPNNRQPGSEHQAGQNCNSQVVFSVRSFLHTAPREQISPQHSTTTLKSIKRRDSRAYRI